MKIPGHFSATINSQPVERAFDGLVVAPAAVTGRELRVCAYRGEVVAARSSGKIKAIIQATVIIIVLLGRIVSALLPALLPESLVNQAAWWLVLVAALYTFYSLYEYLSANWEVVSSAGRGKPGRAA